MNDKKCLLESCGIDFKPTNGKQKFCCKNHTQKHRYHTIVRIIQNKKTPQEAARERMGYPIKKRVMINL